MGLRGFRSCVGIDIIPCIAGEVDGWQGRSVVGGMGLRGCRSCVGIYIILTASEVGG